MTEERRKGYSENEVNSMLLSAKVDAIAETMKSFKLGLEGHMRAEEGQLERIHQDIESEAAERRACKDSMREEMYSTFVKKDDLKLYAFIIITTITLSFGAVTYLGNAAAEKAQKSNSVQMMKDFKEMIKK